MTSVLYCVCCVVGSIAGSGRATAVGEKKRKLPSLNILPTFQTNSTDYVCIECSVQVMYVRRCKSAAYGEEGGEITLLRDPGILLFVCVCEWSLMYVPYPSQSHLPSAVASPELRSSIEFMSTACEYVLSDASWYVASAGCEFRVLLASWYVASPIVDNA